MSSETAVETGQSSPLAQAAMKQAVSERRRLFMRFARNRFAMLGAVFLIFICLLAIAAPLIATHEPNRQNIFSRLEAPSRAHYFGTDELGRDIFSRIVYGARYSLFIGIAGSLGGLLVGASLGMMAGFFGGKIDNFLMRVIDVLLSFPGVLMAILIVSVLGPGLNNVIIALTVWFTPTIARIMRSTVLVLRNLDYVEAARSQGASDRRIMLQHLLPNAVSPIIVYGTLSVATAILVAAGLSFLGLGVQPPTAEWGSMIGNSRQYMRDSPATTFFPGAAIFFTVLSLNFIGDALRDALDPRLKGWTPSA